MLISCFYLKEKCGSRRHYLCGVRQAEDGAGKADGPGWLLPSWMLGPTSSGYLPAQTLPGLGLGELEVLEEWDPAQHDQGILLWFQYNE